ncbi:hypothetical protein TNCV_2003671 [Trichonephila clavipes]|nr:hypothetical protein TNCV_2003671 [Trichonephila clavipes]
MRNGLAPRVNITSENRLPKADRGNIPVIKMIPMRLFDSISPSIQFGCGGAAFWFSPLPQYGLRYKINARFCSRTIRNYNVSSNFEPLSDDELNHSSTSQP